MVLSESSDLWSSLPYELWEQILDRLDQAGLLSVQAACQRWKETVISYVMSGRLKSRALVSLCTCSVNLWFKYRTIIAHDYNYGTGYSRSE